MGRAAVASVVALLAAAAASSAGEARERDTTPPKPPKPAPASPPPVASAPAAPEPQDAARASKPPPPKPAQRLRLGPYVDPYGPVGVEKILDVPRFETRVEVKGKAMDTAALTARMEWWMRDFEPLRGAVPNGGSAPSLQEIHEYRPHVTEPANILPILDWLLGKLDKKP
jgi:hypothetical protein